jgi:ligand-binding sensor domain-containing protein
MGIDEHDNKWFCTDIGVVNFDGTNWTTYPEAGRVIDEIGPPNAISIDTQGNIWFGGHGAKKFDSVNFTAYDSSDSVLDHGFVRDIAIDTRSNIWFGTLTEGAVKFDGAHWTTYNSTNSGLFKGAGLPFSDDVLCIAIDAKGNKWFGGAGLCKLEE